LTCNKFENHIAFFQVSLKETILCKIWKLFAFFQGFFQRISTLSNTKITYTFSNVLLKKLDLCKIWKAPSFFLGFFKDTQSNFVFLFAILEFSVLGFLFIVMEKARPFEHWTLHVAAFPYRFTHLFKLYSSMAMVSIQEALDEDNN
jgi:hypothetical protein